MFLFAISRLEGKLLSQTLLCRLSRRQLFGDRFFASRQGKEPVDDDEIEDEPVKYSETKAHTQWRSAYNFRDPHFDDHTPPSQRRVVILSVSIFMIYFFILREENDIDAKIYQPLSETMPHLEIPLLEAAIAEHQRQNLATTEMEKKLAELRHKATLKQILGKK